MLNKKQRRQLRGNCAHLKMKKAKKTRRFINNGVELFIKLNNNNGIVDIQPRIGDVFNKLNGRQWGLPIVKEILINEILKSKEDGLQKV